MTSDMKMEPTPLEAVVSRLFRECPWSQGTPPEKMLAFLESECQEVREEMAKGDSSEKLEEELGDVFFDVLMLGKAIERHYPNVSIQRAQQRAAEKIMARCAYLWGEEKAETAAECEAVYKRRKQELKDERARLEKNM
eukprot:g9479.t1